MLAFLDALGIADVHLVGHSLGGAIALRSALDAPHRVRSLALIARPGSGTRSTATTSTASSRPTSAGSSSRCSGLLFADPNLVSRAMVEDLLKYKRLDGVDEALGELATTLGASQQRESLPASDPGEPRMPVLVIWGELDRIIPATHATASAERPPSRSSTVPATWSTWRPPAG